MWFNQYPYVNLNDLNLDFILKAIREMKYEVENFVSINAIKYANPIQWSITTQYEKNTIVIDPISGAAYISVAPVPAGVALTRTEYWTKVFDLGMFIVRAAKNFTNNYEEETTTTATFSTSKGDWLVWGDTLYEVIVPTINAGDQYVVNSNIKRLTIEDVTGHLVNLNTTDKSNLVAAINEIVSLLGNLDDLTTTNKDSIVNAINEVLSIVINCNISSPEMYGAIGDGIADDTAAVQNALNGGYFIVLSKKYKITNTLTCVGHRHLTGGGVLLGDFANDGTDKYLLILGNGSIGGNSETFSGVVENLTFKCINGRFNYVVCAGNSENVTVRNCIFDLSEGNCKNKMLFFGNDYYVCPLSSDNQLRNYEIIHNTFIYDDVELNDNMCESIGILARENIEIAYNTTYHADDDIGIHRCKHVSINHNKMLDNFSGRIYCANSKDFKIIGNNIVQNASVLSQGIHVEWETTATAATETPEDFVISENIVDYSQVTLTTQSYGIRVLGAKKGVISDNVLLSSGIYNGKIVIGNIQPTGSLTFTLIAQDIKVNNNTCRQIFHAADGVSIYEPINPITIINNTCERLTSSNVNNLIKNNVITGTLATDIDVVYDNSKTEHNLKWVFTGTGTASDQFMRNGGIKQFIVEKACKLLNYIYLIADDPITLTGSNYFRFRIYKNGTLLKAYTTQTYGAQVTSLNELLESGDVITVAFSYSGTVPTTQPSAIRFDLKTVPFIDLA